MTKRITTIVLALGLVGTVVASTAFADPDASTEEPVIQSLRSDLVDGTGVFEECMAGGGYVAEAPLRVLFTNTGDFITVDTAESDWAQAFISGDGTAVNSADRADRFWTCAEELLARATDTRPELEPLPSEFRVQAENCLQQAQKITGLAVEKAGIDEDGHLEIVFQHDTLDDPTESVLTDVDRACLEQVEQAIRDRRSQDG